LARFLVTGAAGFIGHHTVRQLTAAGHSVVAVDRRPGAGPALQQADFHQLDLLTCDLAPLLDGTEYIIHYAGQPGVRESWTQFDAYSRGNIEVTQRLLEGLRGRPAVRKFVLASTSSVYGSAPMPAREDGPTLPVSPYGATKLAAEQLCNLYGRTAGIPWLALRYFTVYGPGQRPDMAFTRWLTAARDGTPIQIYGAGDQVRDFTFVADAVAATIKAAMVPARSLAINVGGGSAVPIREAIRTIETITGKSLNLDHLPPAAGDMPVTRASTFRLEREVGFVPRTPLAEGLRRQWDWILRGGEPHDT
jgi:nucleoside-diphosphate-sugar epimerase